MKNTFVILVDENDLEIGQMEKLMAHKQGLLHRAFSVFVFNKKGEMLVQRRALKKYHSPGLWTNACCSHPMPNEKTSDAAYRRLKEELNMTVKELNYAFAFTYKAEFDNGLIEHEYDHVFIAYSDLLPQANPDEVSELKYLNTNELEKDIQSHPDKYTPWFRICFEQVVKHVEPKLRA